MGLHRRVLYDDLFVGGYAFLVCRLRTSQSRFRLPTPKVTAKTENDDRGSFARHQQDIRRVSLDGTDDASPSWIVARPSFVVTCVPRDGKHYCIVCRRQAVAFATDHNLS